MSAHIFAGLDGVERTQKPRRCGLTMVIDWGMGAHAQEDLLATAADHFDFGKIAVGVSRLLDSDLLKTKIAAYQQHRIEPFPGGQFLEYAEVHGKTERYLPAVVQAGYRWVEVSDNLAPVGLDWKQNIIRRAVQDCGLSVFGEVGKKEGLDNPVPLVDNARACLDAGASIILLEAAELVSEDVHTAEDVEAVVRAAGQEKVMFELPGPWISGVTHHSIHRMRTELIARYGSDVNLGNVNPAEVISVEAYRRGLGVNAGG